MSVLALTVPDGQTDHGLSETLRVNMTLGPNYPTGGEPITPQDFSFRVKSRIDRIVFDASPQFAVEYLPINARSGFVKVYENIAGVTDEVVNGTDLSGFTIGAVVDGR
ncbi:hypothetical protein LCGC14_2032340 [marine sediment metagenome]|uniref:Uncharacterized protein n=1 Tax=marine sediment metagenome TaxID=412755 RepID=A0A0F9EU90_9ZZZZ